MTRGNQRDIDRERARKRNEDKNKDGNHDWGKAKENHADAMREKQKLHDEKMKEQGKK